VSRRSYGEGSIYQRPDGYDQAADWVSVHAAQGRETYHCAHLLIAERRVKENAALVQALWTDDDNAQPGFRCSRVGGILSSL
jgi:hypothetical protein